MRKVILLIFFVMSLSLAHVSYGQEWHTVSRFEFELWSGLDVPLGGYRGGDNKTGASIGLDLRYNFYDVPIDCGIYVAVNSARREFKHYYEGGGYYMDQNNRTGSFGIEGNYNFRQGLKVNPYAGLCLGLGLNDVVGDRHIRSKGTSFSLMPRAGVELFHHLRIGAYCQLTRHGYHNTGLTIGIVVGGRPRK